MTMTGDGCADPLPGLIERLPIRPNRPSGLVEASVTAARTPRARRTSPTDGIPWRRPRTKQRHRSAAAPWPRLGLVRTVPGRRRDTPLQNPVQLLNPTGA
jgi:hypothetical protein